MFGPLRRLFAQLLTLVEVRLELISAELSAEFRRILRVLLWALFALLFAALGLLVAALTLVIALWEHDRLLASLWVIGGFLALAVFAVFKVWRTLNREPRLFSRTLDELRRDRDALARQRDTRQD